jgi:hypothetical protein
MQCPEYAMSDLDSLVKANYALTVLRVARTSERRTAAQLVEGLATDFPTFDDRPPVVRAHSDATEALGKLTDSIRGPAGGSAAAWEAASQAVENWRAILALNEP